MAYKKNNTKANDVVTTEETVEETVNTVAAEEVKATPAATIGEVTRKVTAEAAPVTTTPAATTSVGKTLVILDTTELRKSPTTLKADVIEKIRFGAKYPIIMKISNNFGIFYKVKGDKYIISDDRVKER